MQASVVLKRGIIIYKKEPNGYNLINIYSADKNNDIENIFIVYVNNNHFNLIVQKDTNIHPYIDNNNILKIHEKIEKDITKLKKTDIKNSIKNEFFKYTYVNYNHKKSLNLYNEFNYLKYKQIPTRMQSEFQTFLEDNKSLPTNILYNFSINNYKPKNDIKIENRKKEKRKLFRKNTNKNFFLKNYRLFYKYKYNNNIKEKMIPYIYEINNIFYNAHIFLDVALFIQKIKKKYIR